jgi:MtN3 and saliva related transmembrane protein
MNLEGLIGYAAATLTTVSFVPQAWGIFRTRDVSGISPWMYAVFTLGIALWLAYGWMIRSWPVVIANSITFVLSASILVMTLYHRSRRRTHDQGAQPQVRP